MTENTSPTIVIAPDSYKGRASASDAARYLGEGVRKVLPHAEIVLAPMADGGEGTAASFSGRTITLPTTDAAGRLTEASYLYDEATATAYIDVAAASGLPAVATSPVPLTGDTYGTGVLIADAQTRGARCITLALGGTATIDGGTGILVALGATPLNPRGYAVPKGGGYLSAIADIDTAQLNIPAAASEWVLLCDVHSPATGPKGAAATFGPQKGAEPEDIAILDAGLSHLCELLDVDPSTPGMGAAGGLGIGLTWLSRILHGDDSHIRLLPGAPVVAASLGLDALIERADLVITGEGRLDEQSTQGKVVGTVLDLAHPHRTPVAVATGSVHGEAPAGARVTLLIDTPDDRAQLIDAGRRIAQDYLRTSTVQG
ncbi:Glycerate 2-kinase [Corynebacterium lowii]|uniref:Glycerate 2-kinase n=1 Tax=Corynebacterium lowii TaxID=1544413 RepID=A0A0Q1E2A0_9CORY|nr:glycerate kinase [Corynebacterium lowii]KQB86689.1 Glycerate 2-kinase [Corynebacterium lowii]MDP9851374.1 glycerate kinase [Corynebacterium lowii]